MNLQIPIKEYGTPYIEQGVISFENVFDYEEESKKI